MNAAPILAPGVKPWEQSLRARFFAGGTPIGVNIAPETRRPLQPHLIYRSRQAPSPRVDSTTGSSTKPQRGEGRGEGPRGYEPGRFLTD